MNDTCRRSRRKWESCRKARSCLAGNTRPLSLVAVVRAYCRDYQQGARAELEYYANLPTIEEAVARASRAERPDGKRHDHQRRVRGEALRKVARSVEGTSWQVFRRFSQLHSYLESCIGAIPGIGELMVYDTALRIGARLGLEPEAVYVHRGTRIGLKALGFDARRPTVALHELPVALSSLRPHEVEDCLCIYKSRIRPPATGAQAE